MSVLVEMGENELAKDTSKADFVKAARITSTSNVMRSGHDGNVQKNPCFFLASFCLHPGSFSKASLSMLKAV